ncbi:MAG: DUF4246 domain-containing protein [Akkermansiaceae bacterium]|nr:DUF4246 domain-containing protein [Akkermansiaceae bacterium]
MLEVDLDKLTHSIRVKDQWWQKVHDDNIVSKWRAEAAAQGVSDELFAYAMKVHCRLCLCGAQ